MLPDDSHVVPVSVFDLLESRNDPGTERTLELGELDDRHWGGIRSLCWCARRVDRVNPARIGTSFPTAAHRGFDAADALPEAL